MKHQHAELILQYALDAMETDRPWERWECQSFDYPPTKGQWGAAEHNDMQWYTGSNYRRKADAPPVPWHLLEAHKSTDMSHKEDIGVDLGSDTTDTEDKPKPVDLSALIDSGIDCEFWEADCYTTIGNLTNIKGKNAYRSDLHWYEHCVPRMNYWFSGMNFDYPVGLRYNLFEAGLDVEVTESLDAFRITGLRDGYCWPWELRE